LVQGLPSRRDGTKQHRFVDLNSRGLLSGALTNARANPSFPVTMYVVATSIQVAASRRSVGDRLSQRKPGSMTRVQKGYRRDPFLT
jgi:hypothetical protein